MEKFSCCSSYKVCSDQLRCIHTDNPEYKGCYYRTNLLNNRVFYGKNSNVSKSQNTFPEAKKIKADRNLYIACYRQLFAVYSRHKNHLSYDLKAEQVEKLVTLFDRLEIPYRTKIDPLEDIEGKIIEDDSPCNSRAVIAIDGEEFNILNFNSYLTKNFYAEKIAKAFQAKGIDSRIERVGTYASTKNSYYKQRENEKNTPQENPKKEPEKPKIAEYAPDKPKEYVQTTIFQLLQSQQLLST